MNIVQLGTNKGYDSLTPIIFDNKDKINKFIAVEPLECHYNSIKECYKDIPQLIIENNVVTSVDKNELIKFYYHLDDGPDFAIASTNKEHILKHEWCNPLLGNIDRIVELNLNQISINTLLNKHCLNDIEFLFIDVEGLDTEIIKSIDFTKFNIKNIIYEHLHINNEDIQHFFNSKGYTTKYWEGDPDGFSSIATKF